MAIRFDKPPINEVVISTYFNPPLGLGSEHIGLFWRSVEEELPTVSQHAPVTSDFHVEAIDLLGNIKPVRSLTEPLQVAMDNGAKRALIPIENKRSELRGAGEGGPDLLWRSQAGGVQGAGPCLNRPWCRGRTRSVFPEFGGKAA